MRVVQGVSMLRADMIDRSTPLSLIYGLTVIREPILVPDRVTEGHVKPVHRAAITIDEFGNRLAIHHLLQSMRIGHRRPSVSACRKPGRWMLRPRELVCAGRPP